MECSHNHKVDLPIYQTNEEKKTNQPIVNFENRPKMITNQLEFQVYENQRDGPEPITNKQKFNVEDKQVQMTNQLEFQVPRYGYRGPKLITNQCEPQNESPIESHKERDQIQSESQSEI